VKRLRDIACMREGSAAKPVLDQRELRFGNVKSGKARRQQEFA
jgi:hypothetical protein